MEKSTALKVGWDGMGKKNLGGFVCRSLMQGEIVVRSPSDGSEICSELHELAEGGPYVSCRIWGGLLTRLCSD